MELLLYAGLRRPLANIGKDCQDFGINGASLKRRVSIGSIASEAKTADHGLTLTRL
jgi:hypothetical protein